MVPFASKETKRISKSFNACVMPVTVLVEEGNELV
jgi:hypothetical protein